MRYQSNANLGSADLERPPVRPDRQPQSTGGRHCRLGRRRLGLCPPHLRSRRPGQGCARDPVHRLCQPPVHAFASQRVDPGSDVGTALPGLPGHLRGCDGQAADVAGLHLGERCSLLRQLRDWASRSARSLSDKLRNTTNARLSPPDVPGQLVPAFQQPLYRQRVLGQHDLPVRLDRGRWRSSPTATSSAT